MKIQKLFSISIIIAGLTSLYFLRDSSPLIRLMASSLGLLWLIKVSAFIWQHAQGSRFKSRLGLLLFLFAWPGVITKGFTERKGVSEITGARFLESWLCFIGGFFALVCISLISKGESTILNYLSLLSILFIIHLGFVEVLTDSLRLLGFSPASLFDRPFLATSLRDFWSTRWNRAFVDMNKLFILSPLGKSTSPAILTFSIFTISGILHELGISYSDGVSWGKPLLYFVIQGLGMKVERTRKLGRALTWIWILLPAPLLFTPAFTNYFAGGLSRLIAQFALEISQTSFHHYGLLLGGSLHLLVLCASVQVPSKLGWKTEFQKLSSLNRKVFWTYGSYVFSIIIFMSLVSFLLSSNNDGAKSLAEQLWLIFIALFWWARVLTDFFYMRDSDWPKGPLFKVGHICLSTLFISMAILYTSLVR